jgi:hypothetical protein
MIIARDSQHVPFIIVRCMKEFKPKIPTGITNIQKRILKSSIER